jgi:murein DD-endopeptidase MepM/ murein hydrolase activator NlpD
LRFHRGLDLRAAYGTPIRAASAGVVTMAGWAGGYGRQVRIAHTDYATSYAHMSRFAVAAGARVARGQVIGFVGSSGLSTGPHLHFEVIRGGRAVDPRSLKVTRQARVESREERAVRDHLRQVLASRSS